MDYDKYIELNNVTVGDCMDLYRFKNRVTVLNDGRIVTFEKEAEIFPGKSN